jgi:integrase
VFIRPGGEPLNPDAVSIQFKRRAARLRLPPIRFHHLRHGWATMALEAGEHPKNEPASRHGQQEAGS